jgi:hypothetical protein
MTPKDLTEKFGDFKSFSIVQGKKEVAVEALFGENNVGIPLQEFEEDLRQLIGYQGQNVRFDGISPETICANGPLHMERIAGCSAYTFRVKNGKAYSVHRRFTESTN